MVAMYLFLGWLIGIVTILAGSWLRLKKEQNTELEKIVKEVKGQISQAKEELREEISAEALRASSDLEEHLESEHGKSIEHLTSDETKKQAEVGDGKEHLI